MRKIIFAAALALSILSVPAMSTPVVAAPAAAVVAMDLKSSADQHVFSSGQPLFLQVSAAQSASSTKINVKVSTTDPTSTQFGESHSWSIPLAADSFATDGSGNATLATGSQMSPFGSVDLQFQQTGSASECGGTYTEYTGTLSGTVHVNTRTTAWGKFGDPSFSFSGPNTLDVYNDYCIVQLPTPRCVTELQWSTYGFNGFSIGGGSISAYRQVNLPTPAGAMRFDQRAGSAPKPTLNAGTVHVQTDGHGFSGRGSIANAQQVSGGHFDCVHAGVTYTEHAPHYSGDWNSPNSDRLTAHFQMNRPFVVHHAGTGDYWHYTYS